MYHYVLSLLYILSILHLSQYLICDTSGESSFKTITPSLFQSWKVWFFQSRHKDTVIWSHTWFYINSTTIDTTMALPWYECLIKQIFSNHWGSMIADEHTKNSNPSKFICSTANYYNFRLHMFSVCLSLILYYKTVLEVINFWKTPSWWFPTRFCWILGLKFDKICVGNRKRHDFGKPPTFPRREIRRGAWDLGSDDHQFDCHPILSVEMFEKIGVEAR